MKIRTRGFTLVELIVVIVVIGILAGITVIGLTRYQADSRDAQRSSKATVIAEALEKYYDENGEYPSCAAMTAAAPTLIADTLVGTDPKVFVTPLATPEQTNSIDLCTTLASNYPTDSFSYVGDGSAACTSGDSCLAYTLQYKEESTGVVKSVTSRHATDIQTSGVSTISATTIGLLSINVTWTEVTNASDYTVDRATDPGFTANFVRINQTDLSEPIAGLNQGTQYYFRVFANGVGSQTTSSNTASATTWQLSTPSISASTASSSSVDVTWTDGSYETGYTLQYTTSSSNWTSPTPSSISVAANATSRTVSGLTAGTTYYFRLQATAPGATSGWSGNSSATPIGQASIASVTAPTCGQAAVTWNTLPGAATYTIAYWKSAGPTTYVTGRTGTTYTITGMDHGTTYYVAVQGVTSGGFSGQQSSASGFVTTMCDPPAYNMTCTNDGATLTCTSNVVCPAGTTASFYWYANGGGWVTGDSYRTVAYTLAYDQNMTLTVNSRCYTSAATTGWVAASNSGNLVRGIPAPGGHSWIQSVKSNDLNYYWNHANGPGCYAGGRGYHVWTVRRSTGQVYLDAWPGDTNTTRRTGSWPVASWDSYLQPYCQGSTGAYYGGTAYQGV